MKIEIDDDAKKIGDFWFFTYSNVLFSLCIIPGTNSITISYYIEFNSDSFKDKNIRITRYFCFDLVRGNSLDLPKGAEIEFTSTMTSANDFNAEMCRLVPIQYLKYSIEDRLTRICEIRMVK